MNWLIGLSLGFCVSLCMLSPSQRVQNSEMKHCTVPLFLAVKWCSFCVKHSQSREVASGLRLVSKCNDERWPHKREVIFYGARGVQREREV